MNTATLLDTGWGRRWVLAARRVRTRARAWLGAPPADVRVREQLLEAARVWVADTSDGDAAGPAPTGTAALVAEVESRYPGGVRQLALDTFTDALTTTPIERLLPSPLMTSSRGHKGESR